MVASELGLIIDCLVEIGYFWIDCVFIRSFAFLFEETKMDVLDLMN